MIAIDTISATLATIAASVAATRPGVARRCASASEPGTARGAAHAREAPRCATAGSARMPPIRISAIAT